MIDLTNREQVRTLQQNLRTCFENPAGKEVMKFIEQIGSWYPSVFDSIDTNEVIARDANRRLIGTLRSIMELSPEQIVALARQKET